MTRPTMSDADALAFLQRLTWHSAPPVARVEPRPPLHERLKAYSDTQLDDALKLGRKERARIVNTIRTIKGEQRRRGIET